MLKLAKDTGLRHFSTHFPEAILTGSRNHGTHTDFSDYDFLMPFSVWRSSKELPILSSFRELSSPHYAGINDQVGIVRIMEGLYGGSIVHVILIRDENWDIYCQTQDAVNHIPNFGLLSKNTRKSIYGNLLVAYLREETLKTYLKNTSKGF